MEIWKDIEGYEGLYQVSDKGMVKSLGRLVKTSRGNRMTQEKIIGFGFESNGYKISRLYKNGVQKAIKTHRLVAIAFIQNPDNKPEVNHKDGVKTNNFKGNLEWMTSSENTRHAVKMGLHTGKIGQKHHSSKISEKDAIFIKYESNGFTSDELVEKYNITRVQVNAIRSGRAWKHI